MGSRNAKSGPVPGLVVALDFPHVGHVQVVVVQEARAVAGQQRQLVDAVAVSQLAAAEHVVEGHEAPPAPPRSAAGWRGFRGPAPASSLRRRRRTGTTGCEKGSCSRHHCFFFGYLPFHWKSTTFAPQRGGQRARRVGAARVDDEDFVELCQRLQALGDVALFVLGHDHNGYRYFLHDAIQVRARHGASRAGIAHDVAAVPV